MFVHLTVKQFGISHRNLLRANLFQSAKLSNLTTQSVFNPTYISNFSMESFKKPSDVFFLSITFRNLKEMRKAMVYIDLKKQTNEKRDEYDCNFFKGQIDVCKAAQGAIGNFFTKFLTENLADHSNFRFVCPMKAALYYFRAFPTLTETAFPSFMSKSLVGKFLLTLKVQGKVVDNKPAVMLFSTSLYGEIIEN